MLADDVYAIAKPLIQAFEDCSLVEYPDLRGFPTIGWGQRIKHGQYPHGITQAQADLIFERSLEGFYNGVIKIAQPVGALPCELAAMTSFAYNIGFGSWHPFEDGLLTSTLLRMYNQGDKPGAVKEFQRWDHAGGIEVKGLYRRRVCESLIFSGKTVAELDAVAWMARLIKD
jgi:lysozyme